MDMNGINEELKLVEAAKRGDSFAMKKLYENNYSSVCRLAGRYTGNREDAEDIVQDVFIKAFNSLDKFRFVNEQSSFGGWVYRICINLSLNYVKKRKRVADSDNSKGSEPVSDDRSPDVIYRDSEIERSINRAMENLSPKQKMIFVLKHFEGLKISEIAEKMECSVGSVKKQLFRSTEKLQRVLKGVQLYEGEVK